MTDQRFGAGIERPARPGHGVEPVEQTEGQPFGAGPGDHGAVVGTQIARRHDKTAAASGQRRVETGANGLVGGDTAGHHQRRRDAVRHLEAGKGDADPVGHHIGGGGLEGGAEIGNVLRAERGGGFGLEADRRLETGEGEVGFLAADERPGQMEAVGMAAQGLPLDGGAPGIAELQQLGRLVEGFAEGVVDGGADAAIAADAVDAQQLAVTAGDQQQQVGKVEFVGQPGGEGVAFKVVDGDERLAGGIGDGLAGHQADQHAADQAGAGGGGDGVEVGEADAGVVEGGADEAVHDLDVGAGGDFRHDTAESGVFLDLREDAVGQDAAAPVGAAGHHGGGRFIATAFKPENQKVRHRSSPCLMPAVALDHPTRHAGFQCLSARRIGADEFIAIGCGGVTDVSAAGTAVTSDQQPVQSKPIRLGTRGSPLALAQANEVKARLEAAWGTAAPAIEIVAVTTAGDRIQDRALAEVGGKGLFTEEIEAALASGRLDIAVHSTKDMPTQLPAGLVLDHFLPREDVRDAFLSLKYRSLSELPAGAVVGTSSLRRQALVRRLRPDVEVITYRGNVQTRLRKLEEGVADATLLALAGLKRLGLAHLATAVLDAESFPPAVGQGAICIESRADDATVARLLAPIHDAGTRTAVLAERAFLAVLDGSCRTPIAGHASLGPEGVTLYGMILTPDGRIAHDGRLAGSDPVAVGRALGERLRALGGPNFFQSG